ncbi:MAG: helix-turn-helix domain-containing protein [Firmicutes bacterium]|nr:helix-turn-helix domain-containing protein [Bacillota bacterium]
MINRLIADLRKQKGISQHELSRQTGINQGTISLIEAEKTSPTSEVIVKLARFFSVSTDYLLGLVDEFGNEIKK